MFTLAGQPQAERLIGGRVSASYFHPPECGRFLGPDVLGGGRAQPGGPPVVLLGERIWRRRPPTRDRRRAAGNARRNPYTVIGVMPARFAVIPRL